MSGVSEEWLELAEDVMSKDILPKLRDFNFEKLEDPIDII